MQKTHERLDIEQVLPHINWTPFFHVWQVTGHYDGLEGLDNCTAACRQQWLSQFSETERLKAEQALCLYHDGCAMLHEWMLTGKVYIAAQYAFFDAHNANDVIVLQDDTHKLLIPALRQQTIRADGTCLALSDFVSVQADRVGLFAVAVHGIERFENWTDNPYRMLLAETLGNRLAEAASEYLHQTLLQGRGIRPAFGYPALPDVSLLFDVDRFFALSEVEIRLTENAAMQPLSAICGLYIMHPAARYFHIGTISVDQLTWYAAQRGMNPEVMHKWLSVECVNLK